MAKRGKHQSYNKQEVWGASKSRSQPILFWSIAAKKNETKSGQEKINKLRRHHHSPSYGILHTMLLHHQAKQDIFHFIKQVFLPSL